jgi:hypothetical protein
LCFFLRMRLRRFLISDPMAEWHVSASWHPHAKQALRSVAVTA